MSNSPNLLNRLGVALWSAPAQAFGGFMMTGAGIALGFSGSWERVVGSILVASGGVILAMPIASFYAKEEALEDAKRRLIALNQLLATLSGQIETALDEHEEGAVDNETLRRVVSNSLQFLTTAGSQIQEIVGRGLDSGALTQTVRDFREVQATLDSAKNQALESGNVPVVEAIANAQTKIGGAVNRLGSLTETELIDISCPYCSISNEVEIGKASGSSIVFCCKACVERFQVLRGSDGNVLAKQRSPISELKCTNCGDVYPIRLRPNSTTPFSRWCLKCYVKQRIDPSIGIVTSFALDAPLDVEAIRVDSSGHAVCECPDCNSEYRAFAMRDGFNFAACYDCDNLLRMNEN